MKRLAVLFALLSVPALAQQPYAPPDRELWEQMARAFSELSISLSAHNQIQNILANVQREAQIREVREKAKQQSPEHR